jgi:hypothetical protein
VPLLPAEMVVKPMFVVAECKGWLGHYAVRLSNALKYDSPIIWQSLSCTKRRQTLCLQALASSSSSHFHLFFIQVYLVKLLTDDFLVHIHILVLRQQVLTLAF